MCEPWLHAGWPNVALDLDYTMHLPFDSTSPLRDLTVISAKDCLQINDNLHRILPTPHTLSDSNIDDWKHFSNPVSQSSSKVTTEQTPMPTAELSQTRMLQLLELQSDLYQISSDNQGGKSHSRSGHAIRSSLDESRLNPENSILSSLDMILSATQRLIDILVASTPPATLGLPLQESLGSMESGIVGNNQGRTESVKTNVQAPSKEFRWKPDSVTTLLVLAAYSSLLIGYEKLVNFLTMSREFNNNQDVQAPNLSPSLNLGSFKMTATSKLYVGTLVHVIKQMLEQLQKAFNTNFPMQRDVRLHKPHLAEGFELDGRGNDTFAGSSFDSPVISTAQDILFDISKKEKHLMQILSNEQS
jgi:hypothetical protein